MVPRRPPCPPAARLPRRVDGAGLTGCALTADPVPDRKPPGWHGLRCVALSGMDP